MMKCMVMLASAVVGMQVYAATYEFPSTGADIAADWGEGNKPGSSDVAKFVTPKTLTTSENVTFGKIVLTPALQNESFTFDLRNTGKTVEVTQTGAPPSFEFGMRSTTAYLKGGIWNSSGSGYFTAGGKSLCSVIFSDAATLTVSGTLVPGYNSSDGNSVVLAGCTTATVGTVVLGRSNVTGARLEVKDGSTLKVSGHVYTENQSTVSKGTLLIAGTGTAFTGLPANNVQIGYVTTGNKLIVNDHATFTCGQLNVGSVSGTGATPSSGNAVYADNATMNISNFRVGYYGSDNIAEFTNTAVTVSGEFTVGANASATGNIAKFIGPQATLSYQSHQDAPFFGSGFGNALVFADGAQHALTSSDVALAADTHDNVVRVENAGRIAKTGGRMSVSKGEGYANALEIGANGTNQFYNLDICSRDNRIVVSNGVLHTLRNDPNGFSLTMGAREVGSERETSGNRLVLQGASPKVYLPTSGICLTNASALCYVMTGSGYAPETPPVECTRLSLSSDSSLEVDCAALLMAKDVPARTFCLAVCSGAKGMDIPEAVLAAANARLPNSRCRLSVKENRLLLRVPGDRGLCVIVR